ncbi:hypothetical protein QR680_005304 [Steinernema hermaphroditum]|uniref:Uncharacterized protein n=1 Tax=Steinernema hermaphroditum TaxID=289476 RepID=A0AA39HRI6_9BILA|nr:hypothetical protein QR680_005304 [Steinernema hermaphroditum]
MWQGIPIRSSAICRSAIERKAEQVPKRCRLKKRRGDPLSVLLSDASVSAAVVASTLADGFWPHGGHYGGYGWGAAPHYGYGYGSGYGSQHGHDGEKGFAEKFGRGEKSNWSEYNHGGNEAHASGDAYGKANADGYGSAHGHDAGHEYGAPHYGYVPQKWW